MKRLILVYLLVGVVVTMLGGCVTVPQESVQLSSELTKMIRSAEQTHLAMLNQFIAERKKRTDDFLKNTWTPKFMENAMEDTKIMELLEAESDPVERALLVREFSEDASTQIAERRASLMDAIDEIGNALRRAIQEHYADMLTVSNALTAHLRSAAEVTETRENLLAALKVDPKKLLPFDKIDGVLEKILAHEGEVEEVAALVEKAKNILKGN